MGKKDSIIEIRISEIDLYIIDRVRRLRTDRNLSQVALSIAIGLSEGTVGRIENPKERAKYNIRHLNLLAKALKCDPGDLLPPKPLKNDIVRVKLRLIRNTGERKGEPNYEIISKVPVKE